MTNANELDLERTYTYHNDRSLKVRKKMTLGLSDLLSNALHPNPSPQDKEASPCMNLLRSLGGEQLTQSPRSGKPAKFVFASCCRSAPGATRATPAWRQGMGLLELLTVLIGALRTT